MPVLFEVALRHRDMRKVLLDLPPTRFWGPFPYVINERRQLVDRLCKATDFTGDKLG